MMLLLEAEEAWIVGLIVYSRSINFIFAIDGGGCNFIFLKAFRIAS